MSILIYYTETDTKNAEKRTIESSKEELEDKLDNLLELKEIDNYTFFNKGEELSKENYDLLNQIAVTTYMGIYARLDNEDLLNEFGATKEQIEITKKLIKLI